jgi:glucarate dehydratase
MAGLPFVDHAFNATTMTITAHLHVMSTSPVCFLAMQGHPDYLADDYVTPLEYRDGLMPVPDEPGLGITIDDDKVAAFSASFEREGLSTAYADSRGGQILTVPSQ